MCVFVLSLQSCSPLCDPIFSLSLFTVMHWRRKGQPTPVFLPGAAQRTGEPGGLPSMGLQSRPRLK